MFARKLVSAGRLARGAWRRIVRPRVVRNHGVSLAMGAHLSPAIVDAIYRGWYERNEIELVGDLLRADDVIMEVGAGLGYVSTFCAKRLGSERVHAYEAAPQLAPIIGETYRANGVSPKLTTAMLGRSEGSMPFYVHRDFWRSSTAPAEGATRVDVPVIPFEGELARVRPTVLVIDIEGGERELLRGARLDGVRAIVLETHPEALGEEEVRAMLAELAAAGFTERPGDRLGPVVRLTR